MNITERVQAVSRSTTNSGDTHTVVLEQTFPVSVDKLWEVCTNPGWFDQVEGDLQEGGHYRFVNSGITGTIEICKPKSELRITWEYGEDKSNVVLLFAAQGNDSSQLTLQHIVPDNEHWQRYGPAATGIGWEGGFLTLSLHLAEDPRATPEEMAKFNVSEEGQQFLAQTADAWRDAHIAAGADTATAQQAADQTAAFYRGEG